MILEIGKNIRKFYSETGRLYDSAMITNVQMTTMGDKIISVRNVADASIKRSSLKTVIYFNHPQGKITVCDNAVKSYE